MARLAIISLMSIPATALLPKAPMHHGFRNAQRLRALCDPGDPDTASAQALRLGCVMCAMADAS